MVNFDMDHQEIEYIKKAVTLSGKQVLEIGCGSGRLTKQLAPLCDSVMAIDPNADIIQTNTDSNSLKNVTYRSANALDLPFDEASFDIVIFSLSLCCVEPEERISDAILQAIRVLRSDGYLLNLMPSTVRNFDAGYMWYYVDKKHRAQLFDMSVAAARMALKQAAFVHHSITFVEEIRIPTRWSNENLDEVRDRWISRYENNVNEVNTDHRTNFEQQLDIYIENSEMVWDIQEEMQILRK